MRITILGPGALGLLWAARLAESGQEVTVMDHLPGRAARLEQEGIDLIDETGRRKVMVKAHADPGRLQTAELVIVCVKAYQTGHAARTLKGRLPPGARVLTLQNGLGNPEILAESLGEERIFGGTTSEGSTLMAPGRIKHAGKGLTHLGSLAAGRDELLFRLEKLFGKAGFTTETSPDITGLIWSKVVVNVGINALTAILGVNNGKLLSLNGAAELMTAAVKEAVAVGNSLGVEFIQPDMLELVREVAHGTSGNTSSMLQDVRNQKPTEVDFINGAVVRQGIKARVPTPVNQTLTRLVKAIEQNYSG